MNGEDWTVEQLRAPLQQEAAFSLLFDASPSETTSVSETKSLARSTSNELIQAIPFMESQKPKLISERVLRTRLPVSTSNPAFSYETAVVHDLPSTRDFKHPVVVCFCDPTVPGYGWNRAGRHCSEDETLIFNCSSVFTSFMQHSQEWKALLPLTLEKIVIAPNVSFFRNRETQKLDFKNTCTYDVAFVPFLFQKPDKSFSDQIKFVFRSLQTEYNQVILLLNRFFESSNWSAIEVAQRIAPHLPLLAPNKTNVQIVIPKSSAHAKATFESVFASHRSRLVEEEKMKPNVKSQIKKKK
jgi:hypothetical protein